MSRVNNGYGRSMDRMMNVETFGALMFMLSFALSAWALALYCSLCMESFRAVQAMNLRP
jgi:hypothetical protein